MTRMMTAIVLALGLITTAVAAQDAPKSAAARPAATTGAAINLNTASVAQLETLPGIGKATAERILEYRDADRR